MPRRSKMIQLRELKKLKEADQYKSYDGGEDDGDDIAGVDEFHKRKEERRRSIAFHFIKMCIVYAIGCYMCYKIMLGHNPYVVQDSVEDDAAPKPTETKA